MKKIIALATLGLAVAACDPFKDEKAASTIKYQLVTGRLADQDSFRGGTMDGPWVGEEPNASSLVATPNHGAFGRVVVVTTDGLLDGASIETTPQSCLPAGNWLTVTAPAAQTVTGGVWYTCYYPSSATSSDGGSVYIYYSTVPPGPSTAAQPIRAGRLAPGEYTFAGSFKSKNGSAFTLNTTLSVGQVLVSTDAVDDEVAKGGTANFDAALTNRPAGQTNWEIVSAVEADSGADFANKGSFADATLTDTAVYTAPATVPAPVGASGIGGLFVTVRATNNRLSHDYQIYVSP